MGEIAAINKSNGVVNNVWFNGRDVVGIVLCYDSTMDTHKAYIGVGVRGNSEEQDCDFICNWGTKITQKHAESVFGHIENYKE